MDQRRGLEALVPRGAWMGDPFAEVDLRVGGRVRITMRDPEVGAEHAEAASTR